MTLNDIFEAYQGFEWLFVRPGGNWGDYLIYSGAESLADKAGLNWKTVDAESLVEITNAEKKCVYLHGSGGYNSWCSGRPFIDLDNATSLPFKVVVQGPCSLEENNESIVTRILSAGLPLEGTRMCFFTREKTSAKIALELNQASKGRIETYCDHDTALNLNCSDVLELARLEKMPRPRYSLHVIREDQEAPTDHSNRFGIKQVYMDPAHRAISYEHWLRIHLFANEIITNRLHSAILGCIIGKAVTVSGGNYHKNHSIWSYSLKGRGVDWCEADRFTSTFKGIQLPAPIGNSYKVNRLIDRINRVPLR